MGHYKNDVRHAVHQFVKDRVEVSILYQYKSGSTWKNANTNSKWSKTAKYRMVTKWRRRNVTIKHKDLFVTFQQGSKLIFYKNSSFTTKQKDFTVGVTDQGDTGWHNLITLYFKVKGTYNSGTKVWGGFIGSTPQVSVAVPFAASKEDKKVQK